jgi:tetratricopeptide (TPR) repeat protein
MKIIPSRFSIPFLIFLLLGFLIVIPWMFQRGDSRVQQAEESYRNGESATTIFARKEAFNSALTLFLQLENEYKPDFGNGKLSFNTGNTYFQLGEYPLALLYYKRAQQLMPRSDLVKRNLLQTYQKLNLPPQNRSGLLHTLSLAPWISLPERLQLFFIAALLTLFSACMWLWTKKKWLANISIITLFLSVPLLLNLVLTYYLSPIEAILIQSTDLHRDAGKEYAKVSEQPLPPGSTLEVVGTSPNGKWVKVFLPNKEFGYVPSDTIRLINN